MATQNTPPSKAHFPVEIVKNGDRTYTDSHLLTPQMGDKKDERFEAAVENDREELTGEGHQSTRYQQEYWGQ